MRWIGRIVSCLAGIGLLLAIFSFVPNRARVAVGGQQTSGQLRKSIRLKEQLETGLKARRPEEFAFIGKVVRLVDAGILPRPVVDGTFLWARRKRRHPFQYFERAIKVRAKRLRIKL
ncbi:MAG: hypothetical protein ACC645_15240 [Pirellulales bacterium]